MLSRDGAIGRFHVHLSFTCVCGHVLFIWSPCVHFLPHRNIVVFWYHSYALTHTLTHTRSGSWLENIVSAARAV